jgi:hypothetical protein
LSHAIRTAPPIGDLGFIDLVAVVVGRRETRRVSNRAVYIHHTAADATDQMVVIVTDAILEPSRRTCGLNTTDESAGNQRTERVIHSLQ